MKDEFASDQQINRLIELEYDEGFDGRLSPSFQEVQLAQWIPLHQYPPAHTIRIVYVFKSLILSAQSVCNESFDED